MKHKPGPSLFMAPVRALLLCFLFCCGQAPQLKIESDHSPAVDCVDLLSFDITTSDGQVVFWDDDPLPNYGPALIFSCNGVPFTGQVHLAAKRYVQPVHGYLVNGRPHGVWTIGDSMGTYEFRRFVFDREVDTIHCLDYERYYEGRRSSRWFRISDSTAVDSGWFSSSDANRLSSVKWRTLNCERCVLGGKVTKMLLYDTLGGLRQFLLEDSLDINWSDDESDLDKSVRLSGCSGHCLCVGVLKGHPWKLIERGGPLGERVEYWPRSPEGVPYPRGVFKHFEPNGEVHSVFVNVDQMHYLQ